MLRLLLLVALIAVGCTPSAVDEPEGPPVTLEPPAPDSRASNSTIATVNAEVITRRDLEIELRFDETYQRLPEGHVGDELERKRHEHRARLLEDLITQRVILQQAKDERIALDERDRRLIEERIDYFAGRYGSRENLAAELQRQGLSLVGLRRKIEGNLLMRKFEALRLRRSSYITPEEIRACHRALEEELAGTDAIADPLFREKCYRERRLLLRQIRVDLDRPSRTDARIHMSMAQAALARDEDFATVAERYGHGPEAEQGGLVVVSDEDALPAPVAAVVRKLPEGVDSEVIEHDGYLMLLRVEAREPARLLSFAESQGLIKDLLRVRKLEGVLADWRRALREGAYIRRFAEFSVTPMSIPPPEARRGPPWRGLALTA